MTGQEQTASGAAVDSTEAARRHSAAAFVLTVYLRLTAQILGLAMPIAMMLVVDKVVNQGAENTLVVLVVGVTMLTLFQYLFQWTQLRHEVALVESRSLRERGELLSILLQGTAAPALAHAGWEVAEGAIDDARFAVVTRPQLLADIGFVSLLVLCMGLFNLQLLAVAVAFIPFYLVLEWQAGRRAMAHAARAAGLRQATMGRFLETVGGAELVRALDLQQSLQQSWSTADRRLSAARSRAALIRSGAGLGIEMLQRLSVVVIMLLGVRAVMAGAMTLGQYIAFNLLSLQLAQPVLRLAAYVRARADQRLRRVSRRTLESRVLAAPWAESGSSDAQPRAVPSLQVRSLIAGGPQRLAPLSFGLLGGTWLGVAGASGVGKSTLLKTLAGIIAPAGGDIRLNGVAVKRLRPELRARSIRLVPQQPVLFTASVAENIGLGTPGASPRQIVAAATACGVLAMVASWPEHLDTVVGPGGRPLSGGEQQRIAMARAVISRPELLLLDEATAALDQQQERALLRMVRRLLPRSCVVFVSHRQQSLRDCDEVLNLDGAVLEETSRALASA